VNVALTENDRYIAVIDRASDTAKVADALIARFIVVMPRASAGVKVALTESVLYPCLMTATANVAEADRVWYLVFAFSSTAVKVATALMSLFGILERVGVNVAFVVSVR
jgi:hypothetical protein